MIELLTDLAWHIYLDAGGRLLGQPGTPLDHLSVDYIAGWQNVAKAVLSHLERESEIPVLTLAAELSDTFYRRGAGAVVFAEFSRQSLNEQIAWEAVARGCCQFAVAQAGEDKDEKDEVGSWDWSQWAKEQHNQRSQRGATILQNA